MYVWEVWQQQCLEGDSIACFKKHLNGLLPGYQRKKKNDKPIFWHFSLDHFFFQIHKAHFSPLEEYNKTKNSINGFYLASPLDDEIMNYNANLILKNVSFGSWLCNFIIGSYLSSELWLLLWNLGTYLLCTKTLLYFNTILKYCNKLLYHFLFLLSLASIVSEGENVPVYFCEITYRTPPSYYMHKVNTLVDMWFGLGKSCFSYR